MAQDDTHVSDDAIKLAVEVAKAGMPIASGSMIQEPEVVAEFIAVVARKIDSLKET